MQHINSHKVGDQGGLLWAFGNLAGVTEAVDQYADAEGYLDETYLDETYLNVTFNDDGGSSE